MEISQGGIAAAVAEEVIPPDQDQGQAQNQVNVQYIMLANISEIVKDAVGGVKECTNNALSSTNTQMLRVCKRICHICQFMQVQGQLYSV